MPVIRGHIETELLSSMDLGCTLESRGRKRSSIVQNMYYPKKLPQEVTLY